MSDELSDDAKAEVIGWQYHHATDLKQPFNTVSVKKNLKAVSMSRQVPRAFLLLVDLRNPGRTISVSNCQKFNSIYPVESIYTSKHGLDN